MTLNAAALKPQTVSRLCFTLETIVPCHIYGRLYMNPQGVTLS